MSDQPDADFDQWLRSALQHWPNQVELRITPLNPAGTDPLPYTFVIVGDATVQATASEHVLRWTGATTMKVEDAAT